MPTTGIPSGPMVLALAAGARDSDRTRDQGELDARHGPVLPRPRAHDHAQVPRTDPGAQRRRAQWTRTGCRPRTSSSSTSPRAASRASPPSSAPRPTSSGPMRSSRLVSLKIARHYKGLLFQSGESAVTQGAAGADPVPQFFDTVGYTFRTNSRYAPDNLMITRRRRQPRRATRSIPNVAGVHDRPRRGRRPWAARRRHGFSVNEHYSTYSYDPIMGTYQKTEQGHTYRDAHLASAAADRDGDRPAHAGVAPAHRRRPRVVHPRLQPRRAGQGRHLLQGPGLRRGRGARPTRTGRSPSRSTVSR